MEVEHRIVLVQDTLGSRTSIIYVYRINPKPLSLTLSNFNSNSNRNRNPSPEPHPQQKSLVERFVLDKQS